MEITQHARYACPSCGKVNSSTGSFHKVVLMQGIEFGEAYGGWDMEVQSL